MISEGKHRGVAVEATIAEPKDSTKAPYAFVTFQTKDGETVDWMGSFSDTIIQNGQRAGAKVADLTIETLTRLGWDGNFDSLQSIIDASREVELVVEHKMVEQGPRAGEQFARVKFINSGRPQASQATTKNLAAKYRGSVLAAKQKAAKEGDAPVKAPPKQAPMREIGDDSDLPF